MHSEPATENRADARGRRRKRGSNGSAEGPVFVDNSGRRSKLLRRIGLLLGALSLGYAVVLGLAFMGIGVSSATLLPFAGGGPGGASNSGPGGLQPQGGIGTPPALPTGNATGAPPSAAPTATASVASN
ncbi:hypothetical protein M2163_005768 [Streptomyces sp. SAI-135]|nr:MULTISPECIES: hypothetical protein [unclassified Streptomyces]MDH6517250.1 hypothetical protein [Streptomyces sp. SAI-090]MDH6549472.1 hypothetical protein [Streptomyces sp. SAI-041]MDH6568530.1 hypothetical protein [Streptomyces sp. SAI-117]MDH6586521.1 hypothetical protein [Streptomyces sp. SAI-133]MDH6618660.1 hypothetical protein [Streptomyces sp. SAI-135]